MPEKFLLFKRSEIPRRKKKISFLLVKITSGRKKIEFFLFSLKNKKENFVVIVLDILYIE